VWTTAGIDATTLANGSFRVEAKVLDKAGNRATGADGYADDVDYFGAQTTTPRVGPDGSTTVTVNGTTTTTVSPTGGMDTKAIIDITKVTSDAQTGAEVGTELALGNDYFKISAAESTNFSISGTTTDVEAGQSVTVEIYNMAGSIVRTANTTVIGTNTSGTWQVSGLNLTGITDGQIRIVAKVSDQSGNAATDTDTSGSAASPSLDTTAIIDIQTVTTDSQSPLTTDANGYYTITGSETSNFTVSGSTTGVQDGATVTLTLTDYTGAFVTKIATVTANAWTVAGVNTSTLSDGRFTVKADVTDDVGNEATDSDTGTQKGVVKIDIDAVANDGQITEGTNGYAWVNSNEIAGGFVVSGTVIGVEAGQTVTVTLKDGGGATATATAVVKSTGTWAATVAGGALNTFAAGALDVTATVVDKLGNSASDYNNAAGGDTDRFGGTFGGGLDKLATVDINKVAGETQVTEGTDGYYYLSRTDASAAAGVVVSGAVTGVENGQVVTLVLTDSAGTQITGYATIAGGTWTTTFTPTQLADLGDGQLIAKASVSDIAGNSATDTDRGTKDTAATIEIQSVAGDSQNPLTLDADGYAYVNTSEQTAVIVKGVATGVELGQTVTIKLINATNTASVVTTTTIGSGGAWTTTGQNVTTLGEGAFRVEAYVKDKANNDALDSNGAIGDIDYFGAQSTVVQTKPDGTSTTATAISPSPAGGIDTKATIDIQTVAGNSQSPLTTDTGNYYSVNAQEVSNFGCSPVGEHATLDRADAHFEHALLLQLAAGRADGVAAAHISAIDVST
jgi:hypothetical protein